MLTGLLSLLHPNSLIRLLLPILVIAALSSLSYHKRGRRCKVPISVNYLFTRLCNKTCGFCFHTSKTSHIEKLGTAKQGLRLLRDAGMRKINFAGGEPFLYPKFLGQLVDYCKEELHLESVSIVSNGSLIEEDFFRSHAQNLDILAVSCDSFDEATNIKIGRGSGEHVTQLKRVAAWCEKYGVKFKINTVVCSLNHTEDMNANISALNPFRWKCFQVLIVPTENDSQQTIRDATKFVITDEQFGEFCRRHENQKCLVPEPNRVMAKSYLILDEYMRFYDKGSAKTSESILEVGVQEALASVEWDEDAFEERGGVYDWTREKPQVGASCSVVVARNLDW